MQICGVDEAGRGPVIGPLVVASFSLPEEKLYLIEYLKVKDSKLSRKKREKIYLEIINLPGKYFLKY